MRDYSIVCAIEAGRLEAQTVLMLTSMKRFGGALASARITAFQGRNGARISKTAQRMLEDLDVDYVVSPVYNRAPSFNFSNKVSAIQYAQDRFSTPWRIWLDSDILFLREPSFARTITKEKSEFIARFEYTSPAEKVNEEAFSKYWMRLFDVCNAGPDTRIFHNLDFPKLQMKPYFNSGVMLWKADTAFAETYARNFYKIVAAKIAPLGIGPWFADQVAVPPSLVALDMSWRMPDIEDHLMLFAHHLSDQAYSGRLPHTNLVHYSKSRNAPHKFTFDPLIVEQRPEFQELFDSTDKLLKDQHQNVAYQAQKLYRRARQSLFARMCKQL